jgi:hypothetical protein
MTRDVVSFQLLRGPDRRTPDEALWIDLIGDSDLSKAFKGVGEERIRALGEEMTAIPLVQNFTQMVALPLAQLTNEQRQTIARNWLTGEFSALSATESTLDPLLLKLDDWLVSQDNRPEGSAFESKLLELVRTVQPNASAASDFIARRDFLTAFYRLVGTLIAGMLVLRDYSLFSLMQRQRLFRLLIVHALVIRWCAEPQSVDEKSEIAYFLRFARIRLPLFLLALWRQPESLARQPGFIDHYVVREAWEKYQLGELADVISVMPGEERERTHVRVNETETTTDDEKERIEIDQRNLQSENRFEFSQAMQEAENVRAGMDMRLNATYRPPGSEINLQVGGHFEYSSESSKQTASAQTRNLIEQAASLVQQRTFQRRQYRELNRITETNRHKFSNVDAGAKPINGLYRWVERVTRVTLQRYPRRYVLEFVLPEPGAWLRWALSNRGRDSRLPPPPPAWPGLLQSAADINATEGNINDYRVLAKVLSVTDLPPYPGPRVLGVTLSAEAEEGRPYPVNGNGTADDKNSDFYKKYPNQYAAQARVVVPDGWKAVSFRATGTTKGQGFATDTMGTVYVTVGNVRVRIDCNNGRVGEPAVGEPPANSPIDGGELPGLTTGTIPLHAMGLRVLGFAVNVVVQCVPSEETIRSWQQTVFDQLLQGWQKQKAAYENAVEAKRISGDLDDRALSPGRVRDLIQTELRRQIITLLYPQMPLAQTMRLSANNEPIAEAAALAQRAPFILFFEQAFEWSTMTWMLYPFYWGGTGNWTNAATVETSNPEFDRFVQSGAARVVVPARPGFAEQVQFYLDYGVIWGGGGVPAPNDPNYLSVAEEIMDLQRGPRDGEVVESWTITLPTALTALDPDATLPLITGS